MLPFSSSFVPGHITINISSLFELFSRIRNNPGVEQFVAEQLQVSCRKDRKLWTEHRDIIFRKLFNLDGLESSTREFAYEITTNGYEACVLLRCEAQELDGDEFVVAANPLTATKKRKTNDGLSVASVKTDPIGIALAKLPPGYEPDVMIGIDPGVKNVCTAACVGWLPGRRQRRRRNRCLKRSRSSKRRRKRNSNKQPGKHSGATGNFKGNGKPRRKRKPKNRHGQRIVAITTAEYYHLAMFDKQRSWNINLKKREPWYAAVTAAMPSFKTADLEEYVERLKYFLAHLNFLVAFSSEESFRKWRFLTKSKKMTATATLTKRLVPRPSAQVCIAFGDWSCQDGLRGNRHAPVKALKKALERRATVLPMDEFRTSKLCSDCNKILDKAVLLTKAKDRDTHEIKVVLKKNRNVFHCANSRCRANFWNRDVNAARNILDLLRCKLLGLGRLAAFER